MVFAAKPPRERVLTIPAQTTRFAIPPGADNHEVKFGLTFQSGAKLLSMAPHMHARGKSMTARLVQPDGESIDLLSMKWDFNWQIFYELGDPLAVRQGSRLEASAIFDNSANNPHNPDPKVEVRWGEQTWEEMAMCILSVAFDASKDPRELFRAPKKPAPAATGALDQSRIVHGPKECAERNRPEATMKRET
jgi:hypothetical protein